MDTSGHGGELRWSRGGAVSCERERVSDQGEREVDDDDLGRLQAQEEDTGKQEVARASPACSPWRQQPGWREEEDQPAPGLGCLG